MLKHIFTELVEPLAITARVKLSCFYLNQKQKACFNNWGKERYGISFLLDRNKVSFCFFCASFLALTLIIKIAGIFPFPVSDIYYLFPGSNYQNWNQHWKNHQHRTETWIVLCCRVGTEAESTKSELLLLHMCDVFINARHNNNICFVMIYLIHIQSNTHWKPLIRLFIFSVFRVVFEISKFDEEQIGILSAIPSARFIFSFSWACSYTQSEVSTAKKG